MKFVLPDKKKPLLLVFGWACPECRAKLEKKHLTVFGYDLVCPSCSYEVGMLMGGKLKDK